MARTNTLPFFKLLTIVFLFGLSAVALAQFSVGDMLGKEDETSEYDYCVKRWNKEASYFDCDCIKENAADMRQKMSEDALEKNQRKISMLEKRNANDKKQIAKTDNANRIKSLESKVASREAEIAKLSTLKGPDTHMIAAVMRAFDGNAMCRSYDGAKEAASKRCLADSQKKDKSLTEDLCACEADAVAQYWLDSKGNELGSVSRGKVFNMAHTKSRKACKTTDG